MNFSEIAARVGKLAADNSPAILSAIAITGTVTTAILTGKATVKATRLVDNVEAELAHDIEPKEKVRLCWQFYIPAASSAVATVVAIVCTERIGTRRAAALASAYTISQKAFTEYKAKVVEKLGAPKEQAIRDEVAKDRMEKAVAENPQIVIVADGEVLCLDELSGRIFKSDVESIKHAVNRVNNQINRDGYASLNDFYAYVGLPSNEIGEELGWNGDLMDFGISWTGVEGKPCMSIYFTTKPVRKYYKFG